MMNPSAYVTPPLSIPGVFSLEQPLAILSPNQPGTLSSSYYGYNNQSSSKQLSVNPVAKDAETAKNKSKAPASQPSKPKAPATNNNPKSQTSTPPKAATTPSKAVNEQSASSVLPSDASITKPLPKQNWLSLAYQSYQGQDTPEVREWKHKNTELTPDWIVKITKDMEGSTIPVPKLPGLVGRAAIEFFSETVEFAGDVLVFNVSEIASFVKGEQTKTEKAVKLMSKFVGEEVARIAAKEDPQSLKIAKEIVSNFNNLSQEDKVVFGTKLMFSLLPCIALNASKVSSEGAAKLLRIAKEAEKPLTVPQPVIFSKGPSNLPKDSKNLGNFALNLQETPKIEIPGDLAKTFTPQASSFGKANIAQVQYLKQDLEYRTCQSIFNSEGGLSFSAIQESLLIKTGDRLHNKELILELSKRGALKDWGKYRTSSFSTPYPSNNIAKSTRNVEAEVHFYRNMVTGGVYYAKDYKVKLQLPGNPHMPVEHFISELPHSWRTKP